MFSITNLCYSPIFARVFTDNQTQRTYRMYSASLFAMEHQIDSGLSIGVFDTEYEYRRPESASTKGALYWDLSDENATPKQLLEQMDFPLVSQAMAYDSFNELDRDKMPELIAAVPFYGPCLDILAATDTRDKSTWVAMAPNEVVFRNSTSTRPGYEGYGLMKATAYYMMRELAKKGFRGVQIEAFNDAVVRVWNKPPRPFEAEVVSEINAWDFKQLGQDAQVMHPYRPAKTRICKIYVTLRNGC